MKLPPAREVKMMLTMGGASERTRPRLVPKGVAKENRKRNQKRRLNGNPTFYIAILMDIASANLWTRMDTMRLMKGFISCIKPNASPSKIECTLSAIIRTNGKKFIGCFFFFA